MSSLSLFFLGAPRIELQGDVVSSDTRKATALLAYLALTGERPTREWLAAFLWPDYDESRARAALRRTLSALKKAVGSRAIEATRDAIGLDPTAVWCDVNQFQHCLANDDLEAAVALYRDDFLAGFSLRDSLPFDEWQLVQQEHLRRELTRALAHLTQSATSEQALDYGRRWCRLDPLREEAHRRLMELFVANGRHADALRQYRECVRILDEELGVPPLPETTALYHAVQSDRANLVQQPTEPPELPALPPRAPPSPLVGRAADLARMRSVYRQVGPDARLLIVDGEPGIGKTRLAEALVAEAVTAGAAILSARCYEGETGLAYAPIIQALQEALSDERLHDRLNKLPAQHVAEAARLLPQLGTDRLLPALPALAAPGEQFRYYEGLAQLLAALLDGPVPGIFWLDDVHWLDAASQELLLYLLRRWRKRPFLVLLCWRSEGLTPAHPLPLLAATLRRAGACETVHPERFTVAQVRDLLLDSGRRFAPDLPQRLFAEAEGLPFFVVEYLNALDPEDLSAAKLEAIGLPTSVRDLLHNRLARIGDVERQIVQAAAAIGHGFDAPIIEAASGRSAEETVGALELLTARGLLVEEPAGYTFSHEKLRDLVYQEMGLARRRLLHRRLAETLSRQRFTGAGAFAQIASHYQRAGAEAEAVDYYVQAGEQARTLFAHRDAIRYFQAALALGAPDAWQLHAACGELRVRLGDYPAALASYETAAALAPPTALGTLEHQLAQVYLRQGDWSLAALTLAQAEQHLGATVEPAIRARIAIDRSLVAHRRRQPEDALRLAEQARLLAVSGDNRPVQALADNLLGLLARSRNELDQAVAFLERSCRSADETDRLDIQIAARNNLALTLSLSHQFEAARQQLEDALALCRRYGDRHREAALRSNLADVLHRLGQSAAAEEQIRESVMIFAEIGRDEDRWQPEVWKLMEW